ncbi:MAG: flagellar biosynthetic protein FliO, partial [Mariprofundaceae bacterium]|nr:flagellar biosynthetic protein FliO [Mariprofundaceae bacterium]
WFNPLLHWHLVLAIFAVLVWLLKRLQKQHLPHQKGETMRVVQRVSLDSQHAILEVLRDDKIYILGVSNGHMQLIDKVAVKEELQHMEKKQHV